MFLLTPTTVVTSASDLTTASKCEFAFARQLDAKLGRIAAVEEAPDAMLKRAGKLGGEHEERWLDHYRATTTVVEIDRPRSMSPEHLRERAAETLEAFAAKAEVVFQATFFDESNAASPFVGFADFIVRQPDGRYRVQDTKLARHVKVTALLQLAAYHEQLTRLGVPADDTVEIILGTDEISQHGIHEILPVYRNRRARILELVASRLADTEAVQWGDARYALDGRCEWCSAEVLAARDLLLVAGIRVTQRAQLIDAGLLTLDDLAATPIRPAECTLPERTYAQLQAQAALQASAVITDDPHAAPPFHMFNPGEIAHLPPADRGDIFFDFEGDPLYREPGTAAAATASSDAWGLDYLFGWVDADERFTALWAHDHAEEKVALLAFLDFVQKRRAEHPGMHIYHYASYERTHLLSLAARHGVGEHIVDDLLRDGVLVDLYPVVKKSVRVGGRSYSIKKLEPLYMGEQFRAEDGVTNAADSVDEYDKAQQARLQGDEAEAQRILDSIADYNEYDCVSTLRLRDWLVQRAAEAGTAPAAVEEALDRDPFEPSALALELLRLADSAEGRARDAYELASAAIDYHRRENKSFWWEHFARLENVPDEWADTRGVFVVDSVTVEADWSLTGRQSKPRRLLRAHGTWAPGSSTRAGAAFALYAPPTPHDKAGRRAGSYLDVDVEIRPDPDDESVVIIQESCPVDEAPWHALPVAVTPGAPPRAGSVAVAIEEWGAGAAGPAWPRDPAADILLGMPPRLHSGAPAPENTDRLAAVTATVLDLNDSYLAVQGPPGTGKTYLAARVIRDLVENHHWAVGVVAQSHKVVEHVLRGVVKAGVPAALVGKAAPTGAVYVGEPFTALPPNGHAAFAARNAATGYVVGGTAWDLTNVNRIGRRQLDLLVIDEAGQFSLANTIAVSVAARNLLLLGDPQQLPQVSQGTHPAPVDQSALGYIAGGHPVLPPELGYFLAESWRMHPDVTRPVSQLAYEGALHSADPPSRRSLDGVAPGLHPVPIDHAGNATYSLEEAAEVVSLVERLLGRQWTSPDEGRDEPIGEDDIIVVTPYNAQVEIIRLALAAFPDVRVGTVDKFQGQEAVVSIVSLAASSPADVPRGLSFLLSANRLNVAISRAQWAAYLLYSPQLTNHLPPTPEGVAELSHFIDLVS